MWGLEEEEDAKKTKLFRRRTLYPQRTINPWTRSSSTSFPRASALSSSHRAVTPLSRLSSTPRLLSSPSTPRPFSSLSFKTPLPPHMSRLFKTPLPASALLGSPYRPPPPPQQTKKAVAEKLPEPSHSNENRIDNFLLVGTADTIGRRTTMEDQIIVARHITPFRKKILLLAVLDGHGGDEASKFVSTTWPRILFGLLDSAQSCNARKVRFAIETSIEQCNESLYAHLFGNAFDLNMGTTLCAVLIVDHSELYCVNVGDSRAIAVAMEEGKEGGKLLGSLSKDHKPDKEEEQKRIEALGGHLTFFDGVARVNGNLSVSRALGDFPSTPFVTHQPDIVGPRPLRDVAAIVICCDGVTDVLESEEIAELVFLPNKKERRRRAEEKKAYRKEKADAEKKGAKRAAERIRDQAFKLFSGDNISVLVAMLDCGE